MLSTNKEFMLLKKYYDLKYERQDEKETNNQSNLLMDGLK